MYWTCPLLRSNSVHFRLDGRELVTRRRDRKLVLVAIWALTMCAVIPALTTAHEPTPGSEDWDDIELANDSFFQFGASVPPEVKADMRNVLEVEWEDEATNNSNGITFAFDSSGPAAVRFKDTTGGICDSVTGWQGCAANPGQLNWIIWIRMTPTFFDWCFVSNTTGCRKVERVGIHEAGHVGGSLSHVNVSEVNTVMTTTAPGKSNEGWDTTHLQRCDAARLQLMYDLEDKAGHYANCLDDLANSAPQGLEVSLTAMPSQVTVCANTSVTISGRLEVVDYGSYDALGGNGLWERTVWIDRGSTDNYTFATTDAGSGENWSKTFVHSNVTHNYVAHYDRTTGEGLANSDDVPFTITWLSPQVPCD